MPGFRDPNTQIVYSNLKKKEWYHWALIVASALGVCFGVFGFCVLLIFPSSHSSDYRALGGAFTLVGICGGYLYRMFRKEVAIEYDSQFVSKIENSKFRSTTDIGLKNISQVIKNSDSCLTLNFRDGIPAVDIMTGNSLPQVQEFVVHGNEDDMARFCSFLSQAGVLVVDDPIPDDDPAKQNAVLFVAMIAIVGTLMGVVFCLTHFVKM